MRLAGVDPYVVPAKFAGGFPSRGSPPRKATRLLDTYLSALSLFTTSFPNPGPQDVPTAARSLGHHKENWQRVVNLHVSCKVSTTAASTDIKFSILLPQVFVSVLSSPQGSPPAARDRGYYSLGLLRLKASWRLPVLPMGAGVGPCAANREQQD